MVIIIWSLAGALEQCSCQCSWLNLHRITQALMYLKSESKRHQCLKVSPSFSAFYTAETECFNTFYECRCSTGDVRKLIYRVIFFNPGEFCFLIALKPNEIQSSTISQKKHKFMGYLIPVMKNLIIAVFAIFSRANLVCFTKMHRR